MDEHALSIVVIVLGLIGTVLLGALLATPAPKHAIVKTFVSTLLARCLVVVVPAILYQAIPDKFQPLANHQMVQAFCVADAIIYLTIAMAAFGISFTMPLLYLSCKFAKNPEYTEYNHNQPFYRVTTAALAFGPFIWALPAIFTPLPLLSRSITLAKPQFTLAVCTIDDPVSRTTTIVLLISALALATAFALVFIVSLWKTIRLPLFTHNLGRFDITCLLRFSVLLGIFIVSCTLYSIITANWVSWNEHGHIGAKRLHALLKTSIVWECVTPILYFCIFAAHEEVFAVWRAWFRGVHYSHGGEHTSEFKRTSMETSSVSERGSKCHWLRKTYTRPSRTSRAPTSSPSHPTPCASRPNTSAAAEQTAILPYSIIGQPILIRPMLFASSSSFTASQPRVQPVSVGLPPPPRPAGSRCTSPTETTPARQQTLVSMPSLTALGEQASTVDLTNPTERSLSENTSVVQLAKGSRPSTADTFGNTVGKDEHEESCVSGISYDP